MYFSKASLFLLPSLLYLSLAKPVPDFSSNLLSLVAPTLGYHVAKPVSSPASTQDLSTGGTTEEQTEQPSEHCRAPSTGATAFQRFTKSHLSLHGIWDPSSTSLCIETSLIRDSTQGFSSSGRPLGHFTITYARFFNSSAFTSDLTDEFKDQNGNDLVFKFSSPDSNHDQKFQIGITGTFDAEIATDETMTITTANATAPAVSVATQIAIATPTASAATGGNGRRSR